MLGLGGVVGFLSGVFGVGGGFLMTPFLIFVGIPPAVAVGTQASQILASSLSGVMAHMRRGNVDIRMGSVLVAGGLVGSVLGVWLFGLLSRLGQIDLSISLAYLLFLGTVGVLMLVELIVAWFSVRRRGGTGFTKRHRHLWLHRLPLKLRFHRSRLYISALMPLGLGVVAGILVAIMGVGGGFLMVPAMIYLIGMPTQVVVGTSLFQITFVTAVTTFLHAANNQTVDVILALALIVGGVIGAQLGSNAGARLRGEQPAHPAGGDRAAGVRQARLRPDRDPGGSLLAGRGGRFLMRRWQRGSRRSGDPGAGHGRGLRSAGEARANTLAADLSAHLIAITTAFVGTDVVLFGTTDGDGDIVVTVQGPRQDQIVRRKARVAGIWINRDRLAFAEVPGYYAVASSAPARDDRAPRRDRAPRARHRAPQAAADRRDRARDQRDRGVPGRAGAQQAAPEPLHRRAGAGELHRPQAVPHHARTFPPTCRPASTRCRCSSSRTAQVVDAQRSTLVISKVGVEADMFDFAQHQARTLRLDGGRVVGNPRLAGRGDLSKGVSHG